MATRERCRRCGRPRATDADYETMPESALRGLCWGDWSPEQCERVEAGRNERLEMRCAELEAEVERLKKDRFIPGAPCDIENCPTYHDGCNCTVETLAHNIDRADKAEAEVKRLRGAVLVVWYDHEDKMVRYDGPYDSLAEAKADYPPDADDGVTTTPEYVRTDGHAWLLSDLQLSYGGEGESG